MSIRFEGVSFSYFEDGQDTIHDFSTAFDPDRISVLTGVSGCGKSTLLYLAAGLYPRNGGVLRAGKILVEGQDVGALAPAQRCRLVSMMFQNPELQFCMDTVRNELIFCLENLCTPPEQVEREIIFPTLDALNAEGRPFKGVIFFGLMLTEDGPKVLEYNARFGDPEAQVVLPRMKNDIIDVMEACIDGRLDEIDLQFEDNAAVCVVLASDGYPVSYEKGYVINGLEEFKKHDGYYCFHAGTKRTDKGIVTNGGRVLGVTAKGANLKEARKNAYAATEWVTFENKYMRHDIGKAIDDVEA